MRIASVSDVKAKLSALLKVGFAGSDPVSGVRRFVAR